MHRSCAWLALAAALVAAACSSGPPGPSATVDHPNAPAVLEALSFTSLRCTGKITTFNGVAVARCGPIAAVPGSALSVATYPDATTAEAQFKAHCSEPLWYFYRTGENWRAAISTTSGEFPRAKAVAIATALSTDLHKGCGPA